MVKDSKRQLTGQADQACCRKKAGSGQRNSPQAQCHNMILIIGYLLKVSKLTKDRRYPEPLVNAKQPSFHKGTFDMPSKVILLFQVDYRPLNIWVKLQCSF